MESKDTAILVQIANTISHNARLNTMNWYKISLEKCKPDMLNSIHIKTPKEELN